MIGFVGIGNMGYRMATNIMRSGYSLKIHSRNMSSRNVRSLIEMGAEPAYSLKEVAESCEFVFLSLPSAETTKQVVSGVEGLVHGLKENSVIIETSTVPPSTVKEIAAHLSTRRIELLDAPVSGGTAKAEKAELTIMVGGKYHIYQRCLPLLKTIGKNIYYVGELGSGEAVKLLNSMMAISALITAREACIASLNLGIDLKLFHEIISKSTGSSWMWTNWIPIIIENQEVKSTVKIALKDLQYARELFSELRLDTSIIDSLISRLLQLAADPDSDLSTIFTFASR